MLFTLILAASAAFTINVISVVAYQDQEGREYYGLEPVNERLKGVSIIKRELKQEEDKIIQYKPITSTYSFKTTPISISTPTHTTTQMTTKEDKPKPKRTPIKVIHDDWFMKHYDRICELEAISHRSVLDMYDHEDIFKQFSDLKLLARNLAWEQQRAMVK